MQQNRSYRRSLIVAATLASAVLGGAGCVARVRLFDADHQDYHRWDGREDRAYRRYLSERHEEYRGVSSLSDEDQRNYWRWRHTHQDAGN